MTPDQCRAARVLLDWGIRDLAQASGVMARTIGAWERRKHPSAAPMVSRMRSALKAAGVVFSAEKDGGVRLRENAKQDGMTACHPACVEKFVNFSI